MKNIGLIDADLCFRRRHRFPNLACMKLSGYHRARGDRTTLLLSPTDDELDRYDHVYVSKVFTDTQIPLTWAAHRNISFGGTGFYYDTSPPLPDAVEHAFPDYRLYDPFLDRAGRTRATSGYTDHSIGFLTRGCFRHCDFCVNRNANGVRVHSPLAEFYDPARPKITLLDDNFFGCPAWRPLLESLQATGRPFRFVQGLDIRLLTEEKAAALFPSKYCGDFLFAFDDLADRERIEEKLKLARRYTGKNLKFYVFCGFDRENRWNEAFWVRDIREVFERIAILRRYDALPYLTRFARYTESPWRGMYITLARWCNQPGQFRKKTFREFAESEGRTGSAYRYTTEFERSYPEFAPFFDAPPYRR